MGKIWTDENKFKKWLDVEIAACEAQAELGRIPAEAVTHIRERAAFEVERIQEIEKEVNHDVIAFLTNVAEHVGPDSRFIHLGMTSSDVLDTANALLMKEAGELLLKDLERLRDVLAGRALEFKSTPCIGRTHGVHAEPITFGLKLALWYEETRRHIDRMTAAIRNISVGKISGAVGTYAHLDPQVEALVCKKLGLTPAPVSNQIIQRDRYAQFLSTLAIIASSLEKFTTEIRALQKTEVLEVEEYFAGGQKGSSAMPHKRNPITCERIAGLARVLRGNALTAFENVTLWHERDISHSSAERIILPDSTIALDYMLDKVSTVIEKLQVYPENMLKNLNLTRGIVFSQPLMLLLAEKGLTREEAYRIVQHRAQEALAEKKEFKEVVLNDSEIRNHLSEKEIDSVFDLKKNLRNVDTIFRRIGLIRDDDGGKH
ncbi:adenylosuccinate lyase [bacterium BMS3Abin05]|nr:adenylosuccinate lyase [bacterium BMS3Abin05]GBE26822.1 adenylosuccinate lyase [bacterium BMS3Bbin03]